MAVKIALAGNPNSGKTTLFNALTGSNQFVGNWARRYGRKEGRQAEGSEGRYDHRSAGDLFPFPVYAGRSRRPELSDSRTSRSDSEHRLTARIWNAICT